MVYGVVTGGRASKNRNGMGQWMGGSSPACGGGTLTPLSSNLLMVAAA